MISLRRAVHTTALLTFALPFVVACGPLQTFDNTGGDAPAGAALSFEELDVTLVEFCMLEGPLLLRTESDVPLIEGAEGCTEAIRSALAGDLTALAADEAIVFDMIELGGCTRDYELAGVFLDDTTVRPWVLLHDITYGSTAGGLVACTDDIFVTPLAIKVTGVGAATDAERTLGRVNPDHPRDPDVPFNNGVAY